jgi:hypothetical protein
MPVGLSVVFALLVQAASAAPADPSPPPQHPAPPAYGPPVPIVRASAKPPVKIAADTSCETARASADTREIVVCAQRPQGYRLDPDVLEAQRQLRNIRQGRPNRPLGTAPYNPCATVGPFGCRGGAMINVVQAAITAVTMAQRLAKGEEIGSMFITDPQPDEYQLYVEIKHRREAEEAAAKAKAKAAAPAAATTAATMRAPAAPPDSPPAAQSDTK